MNCCKIFDKGTAPVDDGSSTALFRFDNNKNFSESQYNSTLGIISIVAISCLTLVTVTGLVFFSPLLSKNAGKCHCKNKKKHKGHK